MKKLYVIGIALLLIMGCGTKGTSPEESTEKGQMTAKINGENWSATTTQCVECANKPTPYVLCAGYYEENGHVQSYIEFIFPVDMAKPGTITYPFPGDSSANYMMMFQNVAEKKTYTVVDGEVALSSYGGIGGRSKGTFSFKVVEVLSGDTLEITDGNFNIPIRKCPN